MLLYITQCLSGDGYGYSYHRGRAPFIPPDSLTSLLFSHSQQTEGIPPGTDYRPPFTVIITDTSHRKCIQFMK